MILENELFLAVDDNDKGCNPESVLLMKIKGRGHLVLAHWDRALTDREVDFLDETFPGLHMKCSIKST